MAKKRGGSGRIEPKLSVGNVLDLRLTDSDRVDGGTRSGRRKGTKAATKTTARKKPAAKSKSRKTPSSDRRKQTKRRGFWARAARRTAYWTAVLGVWAVIGVTAILAYYAAFLPQTSEWKVPKRPPNVRIVSTDGQLLANRGDTGGEAVRLEQLPPYLPQAVMAIEDRRFRSHFGVDPIGLTRAMVVNIRRGKLVQGGSTLTQQLAKNLFLEPDRTIKRKMQEVVLALWLEARYSKDEILEMYLNRVYFGAGAYGVDAAARRYFGKTARHVTLAEAATLAALLKAPSRYAPTRNPEASIARAKLVIAAMEDEGYISKREMDLALSEPARAVGRHNSASSNYVADWVMDRLPGFIGAIDEDIIVDTTIDATIQGGAERALRARLAESGDKLGVGQGAAIVLDRNGAVKAMVGGRDYAASQFNRAVAAYRQPGSAFKPFVYLAAVERGMTPSTIRTDGPISIKGWRPRNYTKRYYGKVTLKKALSYSLNTVAAQLAHEVGPARVVRTAHRLGVASKLKATPSIALGTSEVSLLELTTAYVPFANGGNGVMPHVVKRIHTASGKVLYQRSGSGPGKIIADRHVAMMNDMLAETLVSGTAKRAALPGRPAAGKTGTSQKFRDAWFIGYTGTYIAGVWLGNDNGEPTRKATGGTLPAEIWAEIMRTAHQDTAVAALPGAYRADQQTAASEPAPLQDKSAPKPAARIVRTPGESGDVNPPKSSGGGFFQSLFGD